MMNSFWGWMVVMVVLLNRIGHAYRDTLQERLVVRMMVFKEIIDTIFLNSIYMH